MGIKKDRKAIRKKRRFKKLCQNNFYLKSLDRLCKYDGDIFNILTKAIFPDVEYKEYCKRPRIIWIKGTKGDDK